MKNLLNIILLCQSWTLTAQQTWFVNAIATGANNGSNWQNAFTDLQTALATADFGDQIWTATGTYYPTADGDRNISFVLPVGVSLFGGFDGTENNLTQRNIQTNLTVLSGDINTSGIQTDNSYHVVTIYGGDSLTVLDGFTITKGEAKAFGLNEYGGGLLIVADAAHPVATPIIRQCRFEYNRANTGGGIACLGSDEYVCAPDIERCSFVRNRGEFYGGALYKTGKNLAQRHFGIYNSNFEDNYCFQIGGGIAVINPSGIIRLQGCRFIRDSSRVEAGGVYFETGNNSVRYEIDSCNFTANYSFIGTGGFHQLHVGFSEDTIEIFVRKCLFFLNGTWLEAGTGGGAFNSTTTGGGLKLHNIRIKQSVFESNFSQNSGSGIFIEGSSGVFTDVTVDRCFFIGNLVGASSVAGAFYYRGFGSAPIKNRNTITNSVFLYNDGAIASLAGFPGTTDTRVVNCSFYRNGDIPFVKYWTPDFDGVDFYMNMQILNSVLWEPQVEGVHRLFYNNDPANFNVNDYLVEHSLVHLADCAYDGVNPCGEGMVYAQWPDFVDTVGGSNSLELFKCSPAHNTGSTLVADTFGLILDYAGKPRVATDTVDMGAYESQGPCISSADDMPLPHQSFGLHLLKNPVSLGQDIQCEVIATRSGRYSFQLIHADGRTVQQQVSEFIPAYTPTFLTISGNKLSAGIYFFLATDARGQTKVEKIIVQ